MRSACSGSWVSVHKKDASLGNLQLRSARIKRKLCSADAGMKGPPWIKEGRMATQLRAWLKVVRIAPGASGKQSHSS